MPTQPQRNQPASQFWITVFIGLGMGLLAAAVGYDAAEVLRPKARDVWSMLQGHGSILIQEDSWRGIKVVQRLQQAIQDGASTARVLLLSRPSSTSAAESRRRLLAARKDIAKALREYQSVEPPAHLRAPWLRTQDLVNEYRHTLDEVVAFDGRGNAAVVRAKLEQLNSRQAAVLRESQPLLDVHFTRISEREKQVFALDQLGKELAAIIALAAVLWLSLWILPVAHAWWWVRGKLRQEHRSAVVAGEQVQRLSAKLMQAQEEERRSISRELHDEVGQILIAARLDLARLEDGISPERTDLREIARDGKALIEQSLIKVRDLTQLLRPSLLDDQGLVPALKWLIKGFAQRTKVDIKFEAREFERRLPPEYEIAAYRMVQECLNNIAKHSEATAAKILVASYHGKLFVRVTDNGKGRTGAAANGNASGGLGLLGIRERVENLSGTLRFVSVPQGFCLVAEIPTPVPVDAAVAAKDLQYHRAS